MWDYNGDGIVDSVDDEAYWDDVYFEEHRDDYSCGPLGRPSSYVHNNSHKKSGSNSDSEENDDRIAHVVFWVFRLAGAIFLGFFGIPLLFALPPFGAMCLYFAYIFLGGQKRLF